MENSLLSESIWKAKISSTQKLVLLFLAHCHESGAGSPSYTEIQGGVCAARPTVARAIKQLVSHGLIEVKSGSLGSKNEYSINLGVILKAAA